MPEPRPIGLDVSGWMRRWGVHVETDPTVPPGAFDLAGRDRTRVYLNNPEPPEVAVQDTIRAAVDEVARRARAAQEAHLRDHTYVRLADPRLGIPRAGDVVHLLDSPYLPGSWYPEPLPTVNEFTARWPLRMLDVRPARRPAFLAASCWTHGRFLGYPGAHDEAHARLLRRAVMLGASVGDLQEGYWRDDRARGLLVTVAGEVDTWSLLGTARLAGT